MTNRETWIALAERCEAAKEPDRDIDWAIAEALGMPRPTVPDPWLSEGEAALEYTFSLDAITALIERELPGWEWQANAKKQGRKVAFSWAHDGSEDGTLFKSWAATPALALCAAFCRAMAERKPNDVHP